MDVDVCKKRLGGEWVGNTAGSGGGRLGTDCSQHVFQFYTRSGALSPAADFHYTNFSRGRDLDFIYTNFLQEGETRRGDLDKNCDFQTVNLSLV